MKNGAWLLAGVLGVLPLGCGNSGFDCEVIWWSGTPDSSQRLASAQLSYPDIEDTTAAVEKCEAEQESLPERPANANGYSCNCSSK